MTTGETPSAEEEQLPVGPCGEIVFTTAVFELKNKLLTSTTDTFIFGSCIYLVSSI